MKTLSQIKGPTFTSCVRNLSIQFFANYIDQLSCAYAYRIPCEKSDSSYLQDPLPGLFWDHRKIYGGSSSKVIDFIGPQRREWPKISPDATARVRQMIN